MDLWHPPTDQPHLLEWWRPLLLAGRALRQAQFPWLLHVDEMVLTGRVDRGSRPAIWVYKHAESRGELYLDATGQAYRFTRTPNARSYGRFTACALDAAMWRAGLPAVVPPVFYDEPPRRAADDDEPWLEDPPLDEPPPSHPPRRRGHLTVIDGGRGQPLAG
jgi:hypothetical protein